MGLAAGCIMECGNEESSPDHFSWRGEEQVWGPLFAMLRETDQGLIEICTHKFCDTKHKVIIQIKSWDNMGVSRIQPGGWDEHKQEFWVSRLSLSSTDSDLQYHG
ncbi:hypothetical protein F2P79_010597 [Pimephales promelas]|nr:hypothetical protein F2P79_010597 [Pimephales promelas]